MDEDEVQAQMDAVQAQIDEVQHNPNMDGASDDARGQLVNEISDAGATGYSAPTSSDAHESEKTEVASMEAAATLPEKKKLFNKNRLQKVQSEAYFYQCMCMYCRKFILFWAALLGCDQNLITSTM